MLPGCLEKVSDDYRCTRTGNGIKGLLLCAEQKETEELLQSLEDLKQQHTTEALLQSARRSTALTLAETAGEEPVMQELEEERSRTAGVHVALRKKKAALAERIQELRTAPIGVHHVFRHGNAEESGENASEGRNSELEREKPHGRQRTTETVLKDVLNEGGSVQGVHILLACLHTYHTESCMRSMLFYGVHAVKQPLLPLHAKDRMTSSN